MELLFPLVVLGAMWLLLLRPQQQRVKRHRALLATLAVGDDVVTAGGIVGRVVRLDDERVELEVGPATVLTVVRQAVSQKLAPRGQGEGGTGEGAGPAEGAA